MKIVIVNPPGITDDGKYLCLFPSRWDAVLDRDPGFTYYPYQLAYLSALLKKDTYNSIRLIDGNINRWNKQQLCEEILKETPDILITECSFVTKKLMTWVAHEIKKQRDCYTILCEAQSSDYWATNVIKQSGTCWDARIAGEYEMEVLKILLPDKNLEIPSCPVLLDNLPFPEDRDIRRIDYSECSNPAAGMIQLYATRGCPLSCSYCVAPLYYGGHGHSYHSHRVRDINSIISEIKYLSSEYGDRFTGCFFNEEAHNADTGWLSLLAEELIKFKQDSGKELIYDAMCLPFGIDQHLARKLKNAGYAQLRFGVETIDAEVGKRIKKKINLAKFEEMLEILYDEGIAVYVTIQICLPGSNFEKDANTIDRAKSWVTNGRVKWIQRSICTPLPGTPLFKEYSKKGLISETDPLKFNPAKHVTVAPGYSSDEIIMLKKMANLE